MQEQRWSSECQTLGNMHANYLMSRTKIECGFQSLDRAESFFPNLCLSDFDWHVRGNIEEVCGPGVLQQWECHPSSERSAHSRAATQSWDASQMLFISLRCLSLLVEHSICVPLCVPAAADKQHKLPCHYQTCPVFLLRKTREVVREGTKLAGEKNIDRRSKVEWEIDWKNKSRQLWEKPLWPYLHIHIYWILSEYCVNITLCKC